MKKGKKYSLSREDIIKISDVMSIPKKEMSILIEPRECLYSYEDEQVFYAKFKGQITSWGYYIGFLKCFKESPTLVQEEFEV